ncbi:hypothetical protein ACJX0J_030725, partial [Zea mays]
MTSKCWVDISALRPCHQDFIDGNLPDRGGVQIKYYFLTHLQEHFFVGGTFAMYSLLCRHADIGILPSKKEHTQETTHYRTLNIIGHQITFQNKTLFFLTSPLTENSIHIDKQEMTSMSKENKSAVILFLSGTFLPN